MMNDDDDIWSEITKDVTPLGHKKVISPPSQKSTKDTISHAPLINGQPYQEVSIDHSILSVLTEGRSVGVDHHLAEKLKHGKMPIDITLDLHGKTQQEAYDVIVSRIHQAYANHQRCLLIITGKGIKQDSGVLKRMLPTWLNDAQIRPYILMFSLAKKQHGGEGAFYVLVKRKRD